MELESRINRFLSKNSDNKNNLEVESNYIFSEIIRLIQTKDFKKQLELLKEKRFDNKIELVAEIRRIFDEKINIKKYFCSELSADTFIHLGVLTDIFPVNSYYPKDYSSEGNLGIIKKLWFEKELFIDPETLK